MNPSSRFGCGEIVASSVWRMANASSAEERATSALSGRRPGRTTRARSIRHLPPFDRLAHEYGLKDELDGAWAVDRSSSSANAVGSCWCSRTTGSEPLDRLLGVPMEMQGFLHLAIAVAAAITQVHRRGLVHKDIQAANILVNRTTGEVKLTVSGSPRVYRASGRRPRRPSRSLGTLAYMAPEQTGRNEPLDRRPQRPLRARRHALPDAHGRSAVHRGRSHGMGPLPLSRESRCRHASGWRRSRPWSPRSS